MRRRGRRRRSLRCESHELVQPFWFAHEVFFFLLCLCILLAAARVCCSSVTALVAVGGGRACRTANGPGSRDGLHGRVRRVDLHCQSRRRHRSMSARKLGSQGLLRLLRKLLRLLWRRKKLLLLRLQRQHLLGEHHRRKRLELRWRWRVRISCQCALAKPLNELWLHERSLRDCCRCCCCWVSRSVLSRVSLVLLFVVERRVGGVSEGSGRRRVAGGVGARRGGCGRPGCWRRVVRGRR